MPEVAVPVYVHDDQGQTHIFTPGEAPPAWAVKKITNPNVWKSDSGRHRGTGEADTGEADMPRGGDAAGEPVKKSGR